MNRTGPVLASGLVLLGVLGSQAPQSPSPSSAKPPAIGISAAPSSDSPSDFDPWEESPIAPLCRYFKSGDLIHNSHGQSGVTSVPVHKELKELTEKAPSFSAPVTQVERKYRAQAHVSVHIAKCLPKDTEVRALVVLIPDPVKTNLALEFDRRLDALQYAASLARDPSGHAYGYTIDGHWLPWDNLDRSIPSSFEQRNAQALRREERNLYPGLLLFRSLHDPQSILLMFLVGESPTEGINKSQFFRAIDYMEEINADVSEDIRPPRKSKFLNRVNSGEGFRVDVVGPSFSGSFRSLEIAMKNQLKSNDTSVRQAGTFKEKRNCYRVVTGNATSGKVLQEYANKWKGSCDQLPSDPITETDLNKEPIVSFKNFSRSDDDTEKFLRSRLKSLGFDDKEIAVLRESETVYGNVNDSALVGFSFPRNIARLRDAYQNTPELTDFSSSHARAPRQDLPLVLSEAAEGQEDAIPAFSRDQGPVSQESVLIALADRLRRLHIRIAVILATDPLDRLFLAHYLRKACPDTRIALYDTDRLFSRPSEMSDYLGTMQFSAYPLLGTSQYKFEANKNDPQDQQNYVPLFPNTSSEGIFVAALSLLRPGALDFSVADQKCAMPYLWFTAVGRIGSWPVAIDACAPDTAGSLAPQEQRTIHIGFVREHPPHLFNLLASVLAFAVLLQVVVAFAANLRASFGRKFPESHSSVTHNDDFLAKLESLAHRWRLEHFYLAPDLPYRFFYLVIGNVTLGTMMAYLAMPLSVLEDSWLSIKAFVIVVSALCYVLTVIVLIANANSTQNKRFWVWPLTYLHYALAFFLYSHVLDGIWCAWCYQPVEGLFFSYRATHIESGVSPLMPILLAMACFYLWSWTNARRHFYSETRYAVVPSERLDAKVPSEFRGIQRHIKRLLSSNVFDYPWQWFIFCACFAFVGVLVNPGVHLRSLEKFGFSELYMTLIFGGFFLLILTWIRFLRSWAALKLLLNHLEYLPIRNAFDNLPKVYFSNIIWQPQAFQRSYVIQSRSIDALRALCQLVPDDSKLRKFVRKSNAQLEALMGPTAACGGNTSSRRLQNLLAACSNHILRTILIDHWLAGSSDSWEKIKESDVGRRLDVTNFINLLNWRRPASESQELDPREKMKKTIAIAEEIVALRFVSMIRYVTMQMRNLLSFITFGFVLLVLSLESYPFASAHTLSLTLTVVFLVLGALVIYVFAGLERDAIINRISDTDAGKLGKDFYIRVASYGALPLLSILAAQFPTVGRFLWSWLQPSLEALR